MSFLQALRKLGGEAWPSIYNTGSGTIVQGNITANSVVFGESRRQTSPHSTHTNLGDVGNSKDEASELDAIKEWLSPCNFENVQSNHLATCLPVLDQWFLEHEVFQTWAGGGRPWILQCVGEQGSGRVSL